MKTKIFINHFKYCSYSLRFKRSITKMAEKKPRPVVDKGKCNGCGTCKDVCPMEVFKLEKGKSVVAKPKECIGCRACEAQCPAEAIKVVEK